MEDIHSYTFGLTSKSKLKLDSVRAFFKKYNIKCEPVKYIPTETDQPLGVENTFKCANMRFTTNHEHRFVMSVENGICDDGDVVRDICAVVIMDTQTGNSFDNKKFIEKSSIIVPHGPIFLKKINGYKAESGLGLSITIGEVLSECFDKPKDNWMESLCNIPRSTQIKTSISVFWKSFMEEMVMDHSRLVKNYPKVGMMFQDYMPSLYNFTLWEFVTELLIDKIPNPEEIDIVVGPELKGSMLGLSVATKLKRGLVLLRLKGTLPPPTLKQDNSKKYRSEQTLEMDICQFNPLIKNEGLKVLLIDYVRDTGDSIKNMIHLIEKTGNKVAYWLTISDVPGTREMANKTLDGYPGSIVFN